MRWASVSAYFKPFVLAPVMNAFFAMFCNILSFMERVRPARINGPGGCFTEKKLKFQPIQVTNLLAGVSGSFVIRGIFK